MSPPTAARSGPDALAQRVALLDQMLARARELNDPVGLLDILTVLRDNPDIAWPADPESCARLLTELSTIATEVRLRGRAAKGPADVAR